MGAWRVGGKVPLNVYEGDRPMFQCHTPEDAARIVAALNAIPYKALFEALAGNGWLIWQTGSRWACGSLYWHDLRAEGSGETPEAAVMDAIERKGKA